MVPRTASFDSSLALLNDPYRFIAKRCDALGTDLFEGRLLLRPTLFMRGAEAAELFYRPGRFRRRDAFPRALRRTLVGDGGVQTLDGEAHLCRKAMFLSVMTPERLEDLADHFRREWRAADWRGEIAFYEALHPILTKAVCAWAGVPLAPHEVALRTRQLRALFDFAGAKGSRHIASRLARQQAERWAAGLIEDVRHGRLKVAPEWPLAIVARHSGPDGPLRPRIAAVELLNLLRPTVAVSLYIVFTAHALHLHPEAAPRSAREERWFVEEVRRFYPFFPSTIGIVDRSFDWRGHHFPKGRQVVLDLYGTGREPGRWRDPDAFRPARFAEHSPSPFDMIPQGGGDHPTGHRCPGEWITIALMIEALRLLRLMDYKVPEQDLRIDFARLPALPKDGMRLNFQSQTLRSS